MKYTRLSLLFLGIVVFTNATSQNLFPPTCTNPSPTPAITCELACTNCLFNGVEGTNEGSTPIGMAFCNDDILVQNPVWYGFIAATDYIALEIGPRNCLMGNGLQAAFFESCEAEALMCNAGQGGSGNQTLTLAYGGFIPGRTYYLLIDGFEGDVCDFEINVVSGATIAPSVAPAGTIQGGNRACPGAILQYSVPPIYGAALYHWTAPAGARINGASNNEFLTENKVSIQFDQPGGAVCVSGANACKPEGQKSCMIVMVAPLPPTIFPTATVLFADLPFLWPVDASISLNNAGVHDLSVVLQSWQGCDSVVKQRIIVLPDVSGNVKGTVYWDNNNNGQRDLGEQPYSSSTVVKSSFGTFTNTGIDGSFAFANQSVGDTITASAPMPGINVNPAFRLVQNGVTTGYDFGLFPVPNIFDLKVNMVAEGLRPGFESKLTIICQNVGLVAVPNAVLQATLPGGLQYPDTDPDPINTTGNIYTWDLGEILPGQSKLVVIDIYTPTSVQLGTVVKFLASITPVNDDFHPINNFYTLQTAVMGSFDPNDKMVDPSYVTPGMLTGGTAFEYTIRFQNTGTFQADFVRVIDTLGNQVDPASFQLLATSHPCTWKISGSGVVEFFFQNINLPDSTSDEPGSHGFIKFSIKPRPNLALGTVIKNFCDIYFDFNAPVRTNTAGTQVVYFIPTDGLAIQDALQLRPNPATLFASCAWKTPAPADGRIRVFDLNGLPKFETSVAAGHVDAILALQGLAPGMYFVVLEAGDLVLANKLIVANLVGVNRY